jgi:F0F1-type ATP synthase delta subunit
MQGKARTYAAIMVQALDGVSEKEAIGKIRRLKALLYKRGDFKHMGKILQEFSKAWQERKGKVATVVTAEPLSDKAKKNIDASLAKGGYVSAQKVDESVIGGMALYLGNDYVIDGTIKGKLQKLARYLD